MKATFSKWMVPILLFAFLLFAVRMRAQNNCCNILTNGGFESGNVGFTTGLQLNCGCTANPNGTYCVSTNFQNKCPQWPSVFGNGGSGNFLIIDGNPNGPVDVWRNTVNLTQSGTYCFSFWAATVFPDDFDLAVTVGGSPVPGGTFTVGQGPIWTNYSVNITLGTGTQQLAIRQLTGGGVRDFGLDDIVFGLPLVPDFVANPNLACGMNVQFFSQSTGPGPLTYSWNFGDAASGTANTSTQQNPTHKFTKCGDFEVCLTVSRGSCSEKICKTITVTDDEAPQAKCLGVGVVLNANCIGTVTPALIDGGSTDNCGIASITVSPTTLTGCGLFPVTLTVTDLCGNTSTCTANVQTTENVPPSITCPPPISVQGTQNAQGVCTGQIKLPLIGVADNCDANVAVTNNGPGLFFPPGLNTVIYTATDDCGNTATCSWTVQVFPCDTSCLCPDGAISGPNLVVNGNFSLNTGFSSGYTYSTNLVPEGTYWVGPNPQTVHPSFQPCGDNTTGTGNMMVVNGAPTPGINIWCQTIPVDPGMNYNFCTAVTTVVGASPAVLQFSINGAALGGGFTAPTTTCTWLQFNQSWNSGVSTSAQICIVNQNTVPNGNDFALDDISFRKCSGSQPPVCDSVSAYLESVLTPPGECCYKLKTNNLAPNFFSQIQLTLSSGTFANSTAGPGWVGSSTSNTITLTPTTGPFIPAAQSAPITICNPGGASPYILSVKFLYGPAPQKFCEKTMQFNCNTNPPQELGCPNNLVKNGGFNGGAIPGDLGSGGLSNNWTAATNTPQVGSSDYCCDPFAIQMWGNQDKGESICQVMSPTFIAGHTYCITYCARFVNVTGLATNYVRFGFTASNACNTNPYTCVMPTACEDIGSSGNIAAQAWGNYTFKWTAQNNWTTLNVRAFNNNPDIGNNSNISFGRIDCICIEDVTVPPCKADFSFTALGGCGKYQFNNLSTPNTGAMYTWNFGDGTPVDNSASPMHQFATCGTYTVCLTVKCADGSTSSVCKQLGIIDNVPPVAKCQPGIGVALNANCTYTVTTAFVDNASTDNCLIKNLSVSPTVLTGCGNTTVTLTVTDWCNNSSTCTMGIQTAEVVPPVIVCPPTTVVRCNDLASIAPGITGTATATDNCPGPLTINYTDAQTGPMPCDGTISRTWKATDVCGNMSICTQRINVIDNIAPTLTGCPLSMTVVGTINPQGLCTANMTLASPTTTDNCDQSVTLTNSFNNTSNASGIYPNGATTVTWTAVDDCGNKTTCSFTITVKCEFCPGNLLLNGDFTQGAVAGNLNNLSNPLVGNMSNWDQIGFTTPQVGTSDGCATPNSIQMWGNQVVGEGIRQPFNFQPGCTYQITFCAKDLRGLMPPLGQPNVRIRLRATTGPGVATFAGAPCLPASCRDIWLSPILTSNWISTYSTTWTVPSTPAGLNTFVVTVWNNSNIGQPSQISWARIDDICIKKIACPSDCACAAPMPFSNTAFGYEKGPSVKADCNNGMVTTLLCPNPSQRFYFTGQLSCVGAGCSSSAPVTWELWRSGALVPVASGTVTANPWFGIQLYPAYFTVDGLYELRMVGHCGDKACECFIKFEMKPCPNPCPCDDVVKDALVGFTQAIWNNQCRRCFYPKSLKDCDRVEWSLSPVDTNSTNPVFTSIGNQAFCYTFPQGGIYTITMHVFRPKPGGGFCEGVFNKKIFVKCDGGVNPTCLGPLINPDFSSAATDGILGNGGKSQDWLRIQGQPSVGPDTLNDPDRAILLSGNDDTYDAIRTDTSYCLVKDSGTITLRVLTHLLGDTTPIKPGAMLFVNLVRGNNFVTAPCSGDNCYEVACLQFPDEVGDWVEFEFDYNLKDWTGVEDNCKGSLEKPQIQVRPVIYIGNLLKNDQGLGTVSSVLLDYFCISGKGTIPTTTPANTSSLRIFPNPNPGSFTVELLQPATPGMTFRITDVTGRLVLEKQTEAGSAQQTVSAETLSSGLYFLQVVADGRVVAVEKFVKE